MEKFTEWIIKMKNSTPKHTSALEGLLAGLLAALEAHLDNTAHVLNIVCTEDNTLVWGWWYGSNRYLDNSW